MLIFPSHPQEHRLRVDHPEMAQTLDRLMSDLVKVSNANTESLTADQRNNEWRTFNHHIDNAFDELRAAVVMYEFGNAMRIAEGLPCIGCEEQDQPGGKFYCGGISCRYDCICDLCRKCVGCPWCEKVRNPYGLP